MPYLEQRFEEFNRQMFDGRLPKPPIFLSRAKSYLGICQFQKRRKFFGKVELYNFRIRISTYYDLPENEVEDILIHEMIHYYIGVNRLADASAHGPIFRAKMQEINEKFGRHISISHKARDLADQVTKKSSNTPRVVAVVYFCNGKTGIKILPRILQRVTYYYQTVGANPQIDHIELYLSCDAYFYRFPKSSALNVIFQDKSIICEHLADAQPLVLP